MEPQNDLLDIDCTHMPVQPSKLDNTYNSKKGSDHHTLNNMKELVDKSFSQHNLTSEAQMIIEDNLPCLCGSAHCYNLAQPQPQGGERFALINTCTLPEASYHNNDNKSEVITAPLTSPGYCSISPQHSLCLYSPQQHATNTCGKVYSLGVGVTEKMEVLDVHNELRVKVAGGKEMRGSPTGPQPPAADMMMLEWDEELAAVAQAWVNQCVFKHDCNRCRSLGNVVGRPIYQQGPGCSRCPTNTSCSTHYPSLCTANHQHSDTGGDSGEGGPGGYGEGGGDDESEGGGDESEGGGDESEGGGDESEGGGDESEGGDDESEGGGDESEGGGDESEGGGDESSIDNCPKYSKCQEVYERLADNGGIFVVLHCP
ncbi:hypothetical protein Pcinc_027028 [Petrolisthes cinctipes]|uniref:SCP domain-containing protein n=1 Tax=Petrolisthes cinctipes TaxID=88211 RepID=A0AAE1K7A8_PETCI|nr:hypothetical protein Pcinc_027028 [Petrolisthes cinctipes]